VYINKKFERSLAMVSILLLSGCNGGTGSKNVVAENNALWSNTKSLRAEEAENLRPGRGYNSLTGTIAPASCFLTTSIQNGPTNGNIDFKLNKDMVDYFNQLKEQFSGSYTSPVYSGSLLLKFLNEINTSRTSISYIFHSFSTRTITMSYGYGTNILSPEGKQIYGDGNNPDFIKLCGDTLIKSYAEDADLVVAFNFNFENYEQKTEFYNQLTAGYKTGGTESTIVKASFENLFELAQQSSNNSASMSVNAVQSGGNSTNLATIVTTYGSDCGKSGASSGCDMLLQGLSNYAGNFASQFGQQSPDQDGMYVNRNMIFNGKFVATQKLSDVGLTIPAILYPPELAEIRKHLDDRYKEETGYIERINNILNNYPVNYEWRFEELMKNTKNELESQIKEFQINNADICWTSSASESDILTCKADAERILNTPIPFDKLSEINAGVAKMLVINVTKNKQDQINLYFDPATGLFSDGELKHNFQQASLKNHETFFVDQYLPESGQLPARIVGYYVQGVNYNPVGGNICVGGKYKIYLGSIDGPDFPTIYRVCSSSGITTRLYDYHEAASPFAFLSQKSPPGGSWKDNCDQNRVSYDGHMLSAFCRGSDGSDYVSTRSKVGVNGSCTVNMDGQLNCHD